MSGLQQLADQQDVYAQYLRRLDARAVLEHYGAQRCHDEVNRHDGTTEVIHSCLLDRVSRHHVNGDTNPSAACNLSSRKYVCYSLGAGMDLLHFIKVMEGKEELSAALLIAANFLSEAVVSAQQLRAEVERALAQHGPPEELISYDPSVLRPWAEGHPYWNERQITVDAMELLQLGYDPTSRRIVFPHFFKGQLVGWVKRAIPGESGPEPKYLNSPGLPKSETLYNWDLAHTHPRICVVESPMSVAKAVSLGLHNVVSTFGAKVSREQIRLLGAGKFEAVYIWFDRDAAGVQGEGKLAEGLYRKLPVRVVTPQRGRDLADCDLAEIAVYLKHAVPAALRLGRSDKFRRAR